MSDFTEAADSIRTIAKRLDGFRLAADMLERIGSVDQAAAEAEARAKAANTEAKDAMDRLTQAKVQLDDVNAAALDIIAKTKEDAAAMMLEAEAKSKAAGQVLFDAIVAKANAIEGEAKAQANKLTGQIEYNATVVAGLKDDVEVLDAAIATKQEQLDALTKAFEELRAKLA